MSPHSFVIVAALILLSTASDAAEKTHKVSYGNLPAAVQKAVQGNLERGKIGDIELTEEDGVTTYAVEITKIGKERSYTFATDGRLLSVEVSLDETPKTVQA